MKCPPPPRGCLGLVVGVGILSCVFGLTWLTAWAWTRLPSIDERFGGMSRVLSLTPVEVTGAGWRTGGGWSIETAKEDLARGTLDPDHSVARVLRELPLPDPAAAGRPGPLSQERIAAIEARVAIDARIEVDQRRWPKISRLWGVVVEAESDEGGRFVIVALHGVPYGDAVYPSYEILYRERSGSLELVSSRFFEIDNRDEAFGLSLSSLLGVIAAYWCVALALVWGWEAWARGDGARGLGRVGEPSPPASQDST